FGPLIRLWTMRFESKHTYFKQCARKLHNFKNVCATLAERHQLLQAYLSAGNLFQLSVQVEKGSEFYSCDFNEAIRESVDHFDFQPGNTLVATEITLKGTKYRKGIVVLLASNDEGLEGMSNLEEIKLAISSSLPGLSDETLQKFIHGLSAIGVETKDDLQYVKEEDLMEFLRPIQCRKLLNVWKNEAAQRSSRQVLSDISSPGSESSSSTPSRSTACFSASCAWAETFKVPWEVMPSEIKLAIANKKRPSPADRRKLVRMLEMQNIVKQYPDSFADVLSDGTKIGSGYASLLLQVKTPVEHVNRNNTLARRRKERLRSSCRTISQSSRRLADQYGCVSWQPEEFPAGENDDTLEEKRKQMVLLHSTEGMSGPNRGELHKLMEVTYYRQRRDINATPPLSELKNSWPYLFCLKGIFLHFQLLTDISLLQKIMESIEGKGKRILSFFQEKPTNKEVCAVLSKYQVGNSLVLCFFKLLMAHFKERTESLLIEADVIFFFCCFLLYPLRFRVLRYVRSEFTLSP
uniref:Uncharacterized protein n=1 Tax=Cyprinus carpio TaxID=7962 RepID=A0A8C1PKJ5_CYPCA